MVRSAVVRNPETRGGHVQNVQSRRAFAHDVARVRVLAALSAEREKFLLAGVGVRAKLREHAKLRLARGRGEVHRVRQRIAHGCGAPDVRQKTRTVCTVGSGGLVALRPAQVEARVQVEAQSLGDARDERRVVGG